MTDGSESVSAIVMSQDAGLTDAQRAAVERIDGPLLIVAGPGSGKTRVITHRIARMCEQGIHPGQILAITFTNKAANEMAERVRRLMPRGFVWISTFHRFCARLLRGRANAVGLESNFTILDTGDQSQLIRQVLHDLDIDSVHYPPGRIAAQISNAKNDLKSPEDVARKFEDSVGNHFEAVVARVYPAYQKRLVRSNAVDFDDLLLHVVTLLTENPELRRELGERYRYILVDEYQDTNLAQYKIVAALAAEHKNLCVTGDPDQSIYGWRGARIDNILSFERDFPNAAVIRLEHNFRSTKHILKAADQLIARNTQRKAKTLITDNDDGEPVECLYFRDGRHEADRIAADICRSVEEDRRDWSDFAIFYRVNALSREVERALARHNVPFQVAAGVAFYDRAEIKDVLGYLRLIFNPNDETAFRRVVNTPKRGIGKTTINRLSAWANSESISLLEAAARSDECATLTKRAVNALGKFAALIGELSLENTTDVSGFVRLVLERTGYVQGWEGSFVEQDQQRLANVQELVTAAKQYEQSTDEPCLEGFLETTSLVNEVDSLDESSGRVTLMTLHAAKGLEYPVVYLLGVEQNLLPHERSLKSGDYRELEEERRLLFVGITRAEERLFLTSTYQREFRGRTLPSIPSEFLSDMAITFTDRCDDADGIGAGEFVSQRRRERYDIDEFEDEPEPGEADSPQVSAVPKSDPRASIAKLMTGADLLNGEKEANGSAGATIPVGFAIGMTVRHPRYGAGTVRDIGGYAKRRTVTVTFHDGREETFIADKCPLQPVGMR